MDNKVVKICENCGKEFEMDYRNRKQKFCSYKCVYEKKNLKKEFELICKCGKKFKIFTTEYKFNIGNYKKCCSSKCSNSRKWTDEHKKKLSEINKNSEKVKIANKIVTEKRKLALDENRLEKKYKEIEFICLYCGEIGIDFKENINRKYHIECWRKSSGGIRNGSSRGKCGWYKGYWCDSSYELAFVIYCLEHNIIIERNKIGYEYIYENEKHLYYPDFRVNGILTEIKNFRSKLTDEKLKSVNEKIDIIYKDTIGFYLNYVVNKYGKNFIRLYDNL